MADVEGNEEYRDELFLDVGQKDEPLDAQDLKDVDLANSLPAGAFRPLHYPSPVNQRFLIRYTNDHRAFLWGVPHPLKPGAYDRFGTIAGWCPLPVDRDSFVDSNRGGRMRTDNHPVD